MITPLARDFEVVGGETDALKAVLLEYALGRDVLEEGRGFESMEAHLPESHRGDRGDRRCRKSATTSCVVDPVAEVRAVKCAPHKVGKRDDPSERPVVENAVDMLGRHEAFPLCLDREVEIWSERLERPMRRPVGD